MIIQLLKDYFSLYHPVSLANVRGSKNAAAAYVTRRMSLFSGFGVTIGN